MIGMLGLPRAPITGAASDTVAALYRWRLRAGLGREAVDGASNRLSSLPQWWASPVVQQWASPAALTARRATEFLPFPGSRLHRWRGERWELCGMGGRHDVEA